MNATLTTEDLANRWRVTPRTIRRRAKELGLGVEIGGRAGFRYTEEDATALWESMRPAQDVTPRRRRRRAA